MYSNPSCQTSLSSSSNPYFSILSPTAIEKNISDYLNALTAKDYNANKYYILQVTYIQVPLGTQYGASFTYTDKNGNSAIYSCDPNSTVYYKKAMTPVLRMTETIFNAKKNILYVRDP